MIDVDAIRLDKFLYNNVFIVDDRNFWKDCMPFCDKEFDLVLCVDFALKNELLEKGYHVEFLDHLVKPDVLDEINNKMHHFLYGWYKNEQGNDLIAIEGLNLGNAFQLDLINDVTYFCHFFFNIYTLKSLQYSQLFVATKDEKVLDILGKIGLKYKIIAGTNASQEVVYLFPIAKWMDEATSNNSLKRKLQQGISYLLSLNRSFMDFFSPKSSKTIFFQQYHPTIPIIRKIVSNNRRKLILNQIVWKDKEISLFKQRVITYKKQKVTPEEREVVLSEYRKGITFTWIFEEHNIVQYLSAIVDKVVNSNIDNAIATGKNIKAYFDKKPLHLMIPVTDLWLENRLLMNYCKINNIPVFFIINGLLNNCFSEEGKDSKYVNCYSQTSKEDFFQNAENALPLGDPRMDKYAVVEAKSINRLNPTIVIGAAGYDVTDINSYLAYEFDFLYDILKSISVLKEEGFRSKIILKVRANCYSDSYSSFVNEYFSDLDIEIHQNIPFYDIINRADLYISIFSQTQFEASCLGIPAIYYKKDTQKIFRPFDNKSELVTATDVDSLVEKIRLFYEDSNEYTSFLKKEVLEKYIGPLDGKNLKRNVDFIDSLLQPSKSDF